eukprot:CAMPEP_0169419724 /NCGR_PEP_ID=MMETSP1017-20121227/65161_1 /TAXON_ID=342587 /ORGANISM="Karlodinium micrum, Strain CCMP2283" /LENGTH=48 /DNA_ID= /DNA_START= /DNA_END= /DNA_ORIENTATION=
MTCGFGDSNSSLVSAIDSSGVSSTDGRSSRISRVSLSCPNAAQISTAA